VLVDVIGDGAVRERGVAGCARRGGFACCGVGGCCAGGGDEVFFFFVGFDPGELGCEEGLHAFAGGVGTGGGGGVEGEAGVGGVGYGGFVDGEDGAFEGGGLGFCGGWGAGVVGCAVGLLGVVWEGEWRWKLDVNAPAAADAFEVETLAQNADLAPRVPVRRDEDLVTVDEVMFESLLFEEGVDVET